MIITVTANPSIDRTVSLPEALHRGEVHRVRTVSIEPGGKGVNVAHALALAGIDVQAVLPAAPHDPLLAALEECAVPFHAVPIAGVVRTNLTITEPDGTTTKINEPGPHLAASALDSLTAAVIDRATTASWVVLSGSLPPGVPDYWYADLVAALKPLPCKVAVDTSGAPLTALASGLDFAAPNLLKPNVDELASLAGCSPRDLEHGLAQGDSAQIRSIARSLVVRGAEAVLATLGAAGAILVDASGDWLATPPPVSPRSTVGAGDSALAGYLRADIAGAPAPQRLQMAVAYGSAAAVLPGSALPTPSQIELDAVTVTASPSTISPSKVLP